MAYDWNRMKWITERVRDKAFNTFVENNPYVVRFIITGGPESIEKEKNQIYAKALSKALVTDFTKGYEILGVTIAQISSGQIIEYSGGEVVADEGTYVIDVVFNVLAGEYKAYYDPEALAVAAQQSIANDTQTQVRVRVAGYGEFAIDPEDCWTGCTNPIMDEIYNFWSKRPAIFIWTGTSLVMIEKQRRGAFGENGFGPDGKSISRGFSDWPANLEAVTWGVGKPAPGKSGAESPSSAADKNKNYIVAGVFALLGYVIYNSLKKR